MNSYLISSTKKSSGKTIFTLGLLRLLKNLNLNPSPFKKGPDFIDPLWLSKASGNPCYNLDFYTSTDSEIKKTFELNILKTNFAVVEGNKGLFDGLSVSGNDNNAALAKLLKLEVLLILDCTGTTRGVAPLLKGYKSFDKKIKFKGVILNNIAGDRHEGKIISSIKEHTDFNVLGSIQKNTKLEILERHLGLEPVFQSSGSNKIINQISSIIKSSINLDEIISKKTKKNKINRTLLKTNKIRYKNLKLGVAVDKAFGFYYPDDIEKFKQLGVVLKTFDTIKDRKLPNVDGLFIGGGFPEIVASQLSRNTGMKSSIFSFIDSEKPVYAECGGFMYLCETIIFNSKKFKMVGAIKGKIKMYKKPIGRGYINLNINNQHPWPQSQTEIKAHEFHYSDIELLNKKYKFAYDVKRGYGINGEKDGLVHKNLLASYAHLRDTKQSKWVENFVQFIHQCKELK